ETFTYTLDPVADLSTELVDDLQQLYVLSNFIVHDPAEIYNDRVVIPLWREEWRRIGSVDQSHTDMLTKSVSVDGTRESIYTPFLPFLGSYWSTGPVI